MDAWLRHAGALEQRDRQAVPTGHVVITV